MNWITNYVKPKLQAIVGKKEIPDNLWETCNKCSQMLLKRELEGNSYVCKHCDYHFVIIETPKVKSDPLKFRDTKKYNDRLKEAQKKNSSNDSVLVASGTLKDRKIVVAIFDFNFMGGSMGMAAGEAIIAACEHAKKNRLPLVIFSSSGGARMQEGILSLMQMPRTVSAINSLDKEKLPFISVLTDPTTGGVSASFAMLGDVIIAEKNATIGFAGSRVIEETIKEKLPDNFQKSEYLLEKGMVDIVCHRKDLNEKINNILVYLCE